jgi:hypothetical protein
MVPRFYLWPENLCAPEQLLRMMKTTTATTDRTQTGRRIAFLLGAMAALVPARAAVIEVTNNIMPGQTVTWSSSNVYILKNLVFVHSNAVLKIEPGTVVKGGATGVNIVGDTPGTTLQASGLIVTRHGRLFVEGTPCKPIIFTYDGDDVNDPNDVPFPTTGRWGGVVLLGNGVINSVIL